MRAQYINILFMLILPSLYHMKFTPLNPVKDVGKDIYCQHAQTMKQFSQLKNLEKNIQKYIK